MTSMASIIERMITWTEDSIWGVSLPMFKSDPTLVIPVQEQLKADPSLYVRKSVANNLNDIAKDTLKAREN